ncbi:MAG: hypothetical protein IJ122_05890, partial [Methanobrevibacter sp.]|nr:hypothetical protein [Methanobrevibacter sp.]
MKVLKNCKLCGKEIFQVSHSQGICNSCRARQGWKIRPHTVSKEDRIKHNQKRLKTLKKKYPQKFSRKIIICPCGKQMDVNINSQRKYCSEKCQHKYTRPTWNEENKKHLRKAIVKAISEGRWRGHNSGVGGIRKDLGHYVRSTFEANYARILQFENKQYEFEQHHFQCSDGSYYIPDFYIPEDNKFVEIKGRLSDSKGIKKFKEISKRETQFIWEFIGPN